jgi:enterochelin esterase family protein
VEDTLLLNKGRLENIVLHNTQNAKEYNGQVYIPFGYVDNSEPKYPFAIFHDGSDYIRFGGKNILDNMIANKEIEPIVALFLDPIERNREYAESGKDEFITFIVEDVLPIIKERYNITEDSKSIASIGNSFGGNISALLSYTHPDKIGLCGSLSGAYWVNDNSTKDFILSNLDKPVRYAAIWGTYEGVWRNNQEIASKMEQNGLKNLTNQVNEGHNWVNWRSQLPQVLKFLFNINTN